MGPRVAEVGHWHGILLHETGIVGPSSGGNSVIIEMAISVKLTVADILATCTRMLGILHS